MKLLRDFLVFVCLCAGSLHAGEPSIGAFSWLEGEWARETRRGEAIESWSRVSADTIEGRVTVSSGDGTRVTEYMRIERFGGELFYTAKPSQNPYPTSFKLVDRGERRWVFENPDHDFPQRIIYTWDGERGLHVRIEATADGDERGIDFSFTRKE